MGTTLIDASEEMKKVWGKNKEVLIDHRPERSRFSFGVCLAIVSSIALGFLGGFITAGIALSDNFSSVYAALLTDLEAARELEQEKREWFREYHREGFNFARVSDEEGGGHPSSHQMREQAILDIFGQAVDRLQDDDDADRCRALKKLLDMGASNAWAEKITAMISKRCR